MVVWIVFFVLAIAAFAVAPLAARGDRLSGLGVWGFVGVLCLGMAAILVDMAFNPALYRALLHLAGAG